MAININPTLDAMRPNTGAYSIGIFDGKARYIKFDLNAFAEMERLYGTMDDANAALSKGSMNDIRRILWLGLIWDEAILDEITGEPIKYNLTAYQVGSWLDTSNMRIIVEKLSAAINGALPPEDRIEDESAPLTPLALEAAGEGDDPNA